MTGIPTYAAAVVGQPGGAGSVNQFLVPHDAEFTYASAAVSSSQTTGIAKYDTTQGQYLSQTFTTGASQTAISEVWLQVSTVGGNALTNSITPLTVGIYADSAGEPTGSALGSASLVETAVYASGFWVIIPLPVSGLTASTTYHLVVSPAGTSSAYYVWQRNNQAGGGSISTDFVIWTDQTFGYMYKIFDQTATPGSLLQYVVEDGGLRWIQYTYNAQNLVSSITEYTVDQTGTSSVSYTRNLTYTNGLLTGVS